MKKTQIIRIILSGLFSAFMIKTASVMINLDVYLLARLVLDAFEMNLVDFSQTANTVQWYVWLWNYSICLVVIGAVWKWFGLPENIMPKFFRLFKPSTYYDSDDDFVDGENGEKLSDARKLADDLGGRDAHSQSDSDDEIIIEQH